MSSHSISEIWCLYLPFFIETSRTVASSVPTHAPYVYLVMANWRVSRCCHHLLMFLRLCLLHQCFCQQGITRSECSVARVDVPHLDATRGTIKLSNVLGGDISHLLAAFLLRMSWNSAPSEFCSPRATLYCTSQFQKIKRPFGQITRRDTWRFIVIDAWNLPLRGTSISSPETTLLT